VAPSTLGGDHGAAAARRLWPGRAGGAAAGVTTRVGEGIRNGGAEATAVGGGPSNQPDTTSWIDGSQDPACICVAFDSH